MARGTTMSTAEGFKRQSMRVRKNNPSENPNRMRQPRRLGMGPMMDGMSRRMLMALKGPDKGMGQGGLRRRR